MLKINVSPESAKMINFYHDDDPKIVSQEFCLRENLSEHNIPRIIEILKSRKILALKEENLVNKMGSIHKPTRFIGNSVQTIEDGKKINPKKQRPTFGGKNNKNFANIQNFNNNNTYNYNHNDKHIK